MTEQQKFRFGVVLAILAVVLALAAAAEEPPARRREWPARESHVLALEFLNHRGAELVKQRKAVEDALAAHQRSYEATIAEIRSACPGLAPGEDLRFDPARRVYFVEGVAQVASPVRASSRK